MIIMNYACTSLVNFDEVGRTPERYADRDGVEDART